MVPYPQTRMWPPRPWGARTAKLTPLSGAPGRPNAAAADANQKEASPALEAANCETVATFVGSWDVQRSEWCLTRIQTRPRGSLGGVRSAKLSPFSWAPGKSSRGASYADDHETSPSLGGAISATVATFAFTWEAQRCGVLRR